MNSPLTDDSRNTRLDGLMQLLADGKNQLAAINAISPNWPGLLSSEAEMRSRLNTLLEQPVSVNEAEAVRIVLQEILDINNQAVALIEGHRTRALQALEHKALVRRAASAYSQSAVG